MPGDRYRCCGIQANSSLLPSPGAQRGPESGATFPAAFQGSSVPRGTRLSTHKLPQLCQNPAQLPLAEVTDVPPRPGD